MPHDRHGDAPEPATGPTGDVAHPRLIARSAQYQPAVHEVRPGVWCAVGYGISNTTLVLGPTGAIVIDTGECREELDEVLDAFGERLDRPVVAVLCTHSHYIWGTAALRTRGHESFDVWGHEDIETVIADVGAEIAPAYQRRARLQFAYHLPASGPDSMSNVGLGRAFYRPGRKSGGYVAPNRRIARHGLTTADIAGLPVVFAPHHSDSEDTVVIHFPTLDLVVNNHVWPVLYNIYPLRGERYRDPLVHLEGLARIASFDPEHLVGTHGLPIGGRANVRAAVSDHADAIQYLWDQTVRGINAGIAPDDLAASIELPAHLAASEWIAPLYGEVPYHVRAIHNGLFGWFGTDTSTLHPVAPRRRAELLVEGFGGRSQVLARIDAAIGDDEHAWAAELASHLLQLDPADPEARRRKAACLRHLARRTTAANTRSHYLSEALSLEGMCEPLAETPFVAAPGALARLGPVRALHALRVQLDPQLAADADEVLAVTFTGTDDARAADGAWLHVHHGVCRYGTGAGPAGRAADVAIDVDARVWVQLRARLVTVADAPVVYRSGDAAALQAFFARFDHAPR